MKFLIVSTKEASKSKTIHGRKNFLKKVSFYIMHAFLLSIPSFTLIQFNKFPVESHNIDMFLLLVQELPQF